MKITLILGSIREGRKSDRVARYLHSLLDQIEGVDAQLLDLKDTPLPQFTYRWKKKETPDQNLVRVGRLLEESDGVIFVSPEYHGSYTGVLKNAVDHYWKEFSKKPIGVVSTGSGRMGGINGSSEMQQLVLSLGAYPIPRKLIVPYVQHNFTEEGLPTEDWLKEDCDKFLRDYLWLTRAIVKAKQEELIGEKG